MAADETLDDQINVRVNAEMRERVEAYAKKERRSTGATVRLFIEESLERRGA